MQFTTDTRFRRKPSLTPMIDVVFLLLVFFMLASRFGLDQVLPLPLAATGGDFSGAPKLVDVFPGALRLNGIEQTDGTLVAALRELMKNSGETIILRSSDGANVQRIVTVSDALRQAGFTSVVLVE